MPQPERPMCCELALLATCCHHHRPGKNVCIDGWTCAADRCFVAQLALTSVSGIVHLCVNELFCNCFHHTWPAVTVCFVCCTASYLSQRKLFSASAMAEPPRKRAKFSLNAGQKLLASKGRLPDLKELSPIAKESPAPSSVREKFRGPGHFIGIDVETHALDARTCSRDWQTDEFGLSTKASAELLSSLRMVQLGWAWALSDGSAAVVKAKLIKPIDFTIEPGATEKHGITHEEACEKGVPIEDALQEFFKDVAEVLDKGCRLCAHHMGFDAGIILRELSRAGLRDYIPQWMSMVRSGLCTMDPSIGHWVRQQIGLFDMPRNLPIRLKDAFRYMLPSQTDMLLKHHHAGNDAHMHLLLAQELHRRVNLCLPDVAPRV